MLANIRDKQDNARLRLEVHKAKNDSFTFQDGVKFINGYCFVYGRYWFSNLCRKANYPNNGLPENHFRIELQACLNVKLIHLSMHQRNMVKESQYVGALYARDDASC